MVAVPWRFSSGGAIIIKFHAGIHSSPEIHKRMLWSMFMCFLVQTASTEWWPLRISERQWNATKVALEAKSDLRCMLSTCEFPLELLCSCMRGFNQNLGRVQTKPWLEREEQFTGLAWIWEVAENLPEKRTLIITLARAHISHLLILQQRKVQL